MASFRVRPLNLNDKIWLKKIIEDQWASFRVVTKGKIHYVDKLPGFVAFHDQKKLGLLTYRMEENECEIITLNALIENIGVGTALLGQVETFCINKEVKRLWVITTNDNTDALRFYQKRGFKLRALYSNALKKSRKLKPEIPNEGFFGIKIRDEIELEKKLK
ncbi:hypothetical protein LCGC14_1503240 [marine sediment metagenome]|uniref:N-acetyltransferase domain-containing protein n=1 Tax=marine sediment metagenome TaxID=412755 RepID=A0A0F9JP94_9ZZZZ